MKWKYDISKANFLHVRSHKLAKIKKKVRDGLMDWHDYLGKYR